MDTLKTKIAMSAVVIFLALCCSALAEAGAPDRQEAFTTPQGLVAELYELVTFDPGTKPMVFGDMAHILVLYEASVPGSSRGPQLGVDSFQLIKKEGRWWIVSITNEIPTVDRPVPTELQE